MLFLIALDQKRQKKKKLPPTLLQRDAPHQYDSIIQLNQNPPNKMGMDTHTLLSLPHNHLLLYPQNQCKNPLLQLQQQAIQQNKKHNKMFTQT